MSSEQKNLSRITVYSLPTEILVQIFGYLETSTLQTVASLSPFFNDIINNDYIWKILFIKKLHHIEDTSDANSLPGKRKYAKHQSSINRENLVMKNNKVLVSFPSLSNSFLWKTEFFIRFAYLRKFLNINKNNKKSSTLKDLHKLNPHFVTSAYKIQSNYLIDDFYAEYYNDKLITYSSTTHNMNILGLKQGKHPVQVSSFLNSELLDNLPEQVDTADSVNSFNYFATVEKLCKNLLIVGTSSGYIFIKRFNENNSIPLNISYSESRLVKDSYLGRHKLINEPKIDINSVCNNASVLKLIKKKLLISCIDYNPSLNVNQKDPSSTSLDFITGDLLGQIYFWNLHTKNALNKVDINRLISHEQLGLSSGVSLPILKIQSDYKKIIVIQSINNYYILIRFDSNYNVINNKVLRISPDENSNKNDIMLLWELFNNTSIHLIDELTPNFFVSKIIFPPQIHKKSFMEVDYTNNRLFVASNSNVFVLDFDGHNQEILDTKFETEKMKDGLTEFIIQTKIINNTQKLDGNLTTRYHSAGDNSPLFLALYSSGKIIIHSSCSNGSLESSGDDSSSRSNNTLIIKVIPSFLSDFVFHKPVDDFYKSFGILPILKFDLNSAVMVLSSYNGWIAFVNVLNGNILRIFEDKIPKAFLNSHALLPYQISVNSETEDGQDITNKAVLVPVTALKLFQYPVFTRSSDTQDLANYNWKSILMNGVIIYDNIVIYFQVSFENSVVMKNTLQLSEEALQLQKHNRKVKNPKQVAQSEIARSIKDQMDEFHYNRAQMELVNKLTDRFNGVSADEDDEELMLAIALSNSIADSITENLDPVNEPTSEIEHLNDVIERSKVEAFQNQKFVEDDEEVLKALELSKLDNRRGAILDDSGDANDLFFGLSKQKFKFFANDSETSNSFEKTPDRIIRGSKGKKKLLINELDEGEDEIIQNDMKFEAGNNGNSSNTNTTNTTPEASQMDDDLRLAVEVSLQSSKHPSSGTSTINSENQHNNNLENLLFDDAKGNNDDLTIDEALLRLRLDKTKKSKKFAKPRKGKSKYKALDLSVFQDEESEFANKKYDNKDNDEDLEIALEMSMAPGFSAPPKSMYDEYSDDDDELQRILELSKIDQ